MALVVGEPEPATVQLERSDDLLLDEGVDGLSTHPADDLAATWLESPGHCDNLRDAKYSETGLAYALNPGDGRDIYWVQVYAQPD